MIKSSSSNTSNSNDSNTYNKAHDNNDDTERLRINYSMRNNNKGNAHVNDPRDFDARCRPSWPRGSDQISCPHPTLTPRCSCPGESYFGGLTVIGNAIALTLKKDQQSVSVLSSQRW